jgi:hypothetical protein
MRSAKLAPSGARPSLPDGGFAVAVAILFACICGFATFFHEMWRDEMQAWLIARDSNGLLALGDAIRPEGHPAIWYLLLYGLTRLTHRPEAMQLLHLAIGTACAFVVARSAPFSRWTRLALCLGYFPVYEYGVIARNYSIGILFLLLAASLLPRRRERPWLLGFMLALAAHSNGMALIVATAFAGALVMESLLEGAPRARMVPAVKTGIVAGVAVAAALAIYQPLPDSGFAVLEPAASSLRLRIEYVLGHFAEAVVPITSGRDAWGSFADLAGTHHAAPLISLLGWACILAYLLRRQVALAMFVAGTGGLLWFFHAKLDGSLRHYGFFLVNLVLAVWYARVKEEECSRANSPRSSRSPFDVLFHGFVALVLVVQLTFSFLAVRQDFDLVFSAGRATAAMLVENHLDELPIVGDPDTLMTPILGYLPQRTFYFPRGARFGSFTIYRWSVRGADDVPQQKVLSSALDLASSRHSPVGLVLERRAAGRLTTEAKKIGCADADITKIESYCVFLVFPPPPL